MRFPKACSGVKKIRSAEILSVIAGLFAVVTLMIGLFTLTSVEPDRGLILGVGTAALVFIICGGVLLLVAFILKLIGTVCAGKEESAFKTAMIFMIIGFVTEAITYIPNLSPRIQAIMGFVGVIAEASALAAVMYIILGVQRLAGRCERVDMVKKGNTVMKLVLMVGIFVLLADTVSAVFKLLRTHAIVSGVFAVAAAALSIVAYIIYLGYLTQAKRMLEE
ncbi:MAG: hypothetical protein II680_12955 [Clostridia bacterium]|nr:hypothetical protein [Clostridia bacterium]